MREKLLSMEEAAGWVQDGCLLGFSSAVLENAPMAFLRELVRRRVKNLRLTTLPGGGLNVDFLIGSGLVAEYETSHCSLGHLGPAPNFQRALKSGAVKIKDNTWGVMYSMVQAGSMGLPFIAVRGLLGTDLLRERSDFQVIPNPFHTGEKTVIMEPIRPELAVFHALAADRWGNGVTPGLRDDLMMARAARRVVVTAEQVLDRPLTLQDAVHHTFLPAIDVDAVVHAPFGAHPCSCGDLYKADEAHLKEYIEAAKNEQTFQAYLKKYVYEVKSHGEYLGRISLPAAMDGGSER